ncbi:MAG: hypothetical protein IJV27_02815 [Prevotella sp.]|nr:hypothetical protein [Prevotella sp.]
MRVKCITTIIDNPSTNLLKSGWRNAEKYLTVGKEYEVYAVYTSYYYPGGDAFLICDDNYNDNNYYWPLYIPTCFFETIDNTRPSFWNISPDNPNYYGPSDINPQNYEQLVDGDVEAIAAFRRIINFHAKYMTKKQTR